MNIFQRKKGKAREQQPEDTSSSEDEDASGEDELGSDKETDKNPVCAKWKGKASGTASFSPAQKRKNAKGHSMWSFKRTALCILPKNIIMVGTETVVLVGADESRTQWTLDVPTRQ